MPGISRRPARLKQSSCYKIRSIQLCNQFVRSNLPAIAFNRIKRRRLPGLRERRTGVPNGAFDALIGQTPRKEQLLNAKVSQDIVAFVVVERGRVLAQLENGDLRTSGLDRSHRHSWHLDPLLRLRSRTGRSRTRSGREQLASRERDLAALPMARHLFRGTVRVPSVLVKSAPVDLHFGTGHPASSVAVHLDRHELLSSGAIGRRDRNTGLRGAGCVACFNHVRGAPGSGSVLIKNAS